MQPYSISSIGSTETISRCPEYPSTIVAAVSARYVLGGITSNNVRNPLLYPKPHNYYKTSESYPHGFVNYVSGCTSTRRGVIPGFYNYQELPPSFMFTAAYNQALGKFYDNYRGGVDFSIDGFQTMFDYRDISQTEKQAMAYRQAKSPNVLARTMRAYKAQKALTGLPVLGRYIRLGIKLPAKVWLAYSFLFKPTLSTIYESGSEAFRSAQLSKMTYGRGRALEEVSFSNSVYNSVVGTHSVRCEIGALMLNSDPNLAQNAARFTSLNPASVGWELLPFSFVVDWFFNVGGYLRELESAILFNSNFVTGYVTYTSLTSMHSVFKVNNIVGRTGYVDGAWRRTALDRSVLASTPFPRRPVLHFDTGWRQVVHIAALLSNLL